MFRSHISRSVFTSSSRRLHMTPVVAGSVTEKVSEVAEKVNKGLGKTLAGAIDKGENVTKAALGKGSEASEAAKEKLDEVSNQAREKADEAAKKVKDR